MEYCHERLRDSRNFKGHIVEFRCSRAAWSENKLVFSLGVRYDGFVCFKGNLSRFGILLIVGAHD